MRKKVDFKTEDAYYRKKIQSVQISLGKLGVRTFFVDSRGTVIEQ